MTRNYEHLSEAERRRIERLLAAGWRIRKIARALGRGVSTISEEVGRNRVRGRYVATKAAHKAYVRRLYSKKASLKVVRHSPLRHFTEEKLRLDWSPEAVAGRWRLTTGEVVSPKAIYRFVYSVYGRQVERHLYSRAVKRRGGPKRGTRVRFDGRKLISERPLVVEKREELGHWEGDFIESGKVGSGSALVLVERVSRYPILRYVSDRKTAAVNQLVAESLRDELVKSVTVDNDLSFQKHEQLSRLVGADIFFCAPYHSWEKGTVENRNKAVRRYLPKRCDLSREQHQLAEIEAKLRSRPLKCLGWRTPQEVWEAGQKKTAGEREWTRDLLKVNLTESVRLRGSV